MGENISGRIEEVKITGVVTGRNKVGGIVGYNNFGADIIFCESDTLVSGKDTFGGIVGCTSSSNIEDSFFIGTVKGSINKYYGDIAGEFSRGTIRNCYWTNEKTKAIGSRFCGNMKIDCVENRDEVISSICASKLTNS